MTLLRRGGHSSRAWKRGNALTFKDRLGGVDLRASGETESNTTTRHRGASRLASNFKVQEPDSTVETEGNSTVSSV